MTDEKALARNIKTRRFSLEWSQKELAKKSGISQSTIAHIELELKSPSISTLAKLAKALRLKTYELLKHDLFELQKNS